MSESKKIATLESVVFNYPAGNNALDKITLDLHEGEIIGLVGANGAGKTTLMKLIAGYMDKSEGKIILGGRPIEEYSNRRLNEFVTLVEQNPESQLVGPTVEDELARACRLMGYEGRVIREKVDFVLKLVRMKQAKEWYLDEMSSGERRRVALALALVSDPSILMLDEPLSDLDMVGQKDTAATLRELKGRGLCIIVSSHRMEDILELTDRVAVLGEGRLLAADDPQKVLSNGEILKMACINAPSIPRLFMRLQAEGLIPAGRFPLGFEEGFERLRDELDRRKKASGATQASSIFSKDTEKVIQTQTLPRLDEIVGSLEADPNKTVILKAPVAPPANPPAAPEASSRESDKESGEAANSSDASNAAGEKPEINDKESIASKLSL
jgi:energy-coupling factor transporter ATP-binding protein EcfA2